MEWIDVGAKEIMTQQGSFLPPAVSRFMLNYLVIPCLLITKIASNCHLAGFLGDKGFSIEDPNNKEIEKITKELYEKYDVDLYK